MPFVTFRNALGRGFVVPDAHGGTELLYLIRECGDAGVQRVERLANELEVYVDHVPSVRVVGSDVDMP